MDGMQNIMTQTLDVAVVEDDSVTRGHFEQTLSQSGGYRWLWSADCLRTARARLRDWPDLVLLDLGLPDGDGADFVAELQLHANRHDLTMPGILVVTIFDDRRTVLRAVQSGADGYVLKHSDANVIITALDDLREGGAPLSPRISMHLTEALRSQRSDAQTPDQAGALTPRERHVLTLLARGLSYKATGEALGISLHTVGDFVKSIYRKLDVNSRAEAVYRGVQQQIIRLD